MQITVNGKTQDVLEKQLNINELLVLNSVQNPEMVSVQLNGEFVDREVFSTTVLNNNDEIEFLYFMGGGSV